MSYAAAEQSPLCVTPDLTLALRHKLHCVGYGVWPSTSLKTYAATSLIC
jgi:hypothetical protein